MIGGEVNDEFEAVIRLIVTGPNGRSRELPVIIDTGFSGALTLPSGLVAALELPSRGLGRALLGDGSETLFARHVATVSWDGRERRVYIDAAETEPLVGMGLLTGYELAVQVWHGGQVRISAREPRLR